MADTHAAANTTLSAVQAAIDAASTGDTVTIPAGSSTWAGTANVPSNKNLFITGNGVGSTIIDAGTPNNWAIDLNESATWVSGIEFKNGLIEAWGLDWRVHHCKFDNGSTLATVVWCFTQSLAGVHPRGLIDNNVIINGRIRIDGSAAMFGDTADPKPQHVLWHEDVVFGGSNWVFIEDNTFSGDTQYSSVDALYGGRYVFRHNTCTIQNSGNNGYMLEVHSIHGTSRGGRAWEIYENTIASPSGMWAGIGYIRGGTGVIWNNTITGSTASGLVLNTARDQGEDVDETDCGRCNGTSPWDQNTLGQAGWRCRDQIGAGKDLTLWTDVAPYPTQASEPAYFWGNTPNTVDINYPATPGHIIDGRDYFNDTQRPGYTPYTYPHPSQGVEEQPSQNIIFNNDMELRF
jgi:hypothetical protein